VQLPLPLQTLETILVQLKPSSSKWSLIFSGAYIWRSASRQVCISLNQRHGETSYSKLEPFPNFLPDARCRSFQWRPIYAFPIVAYPVVNIAIQVTLALKFNAVQPMESMYCDVTEPRW
jgi:hypothetical protein